MLKPLFKILELKHYSKNNELLLEYNNIHNMFHLSGEEYFLKLAFGGLELPEKYYIGFDNRTIVSEEDELSDLESEPSGNSYIRQQAASTGEFSFTIRDGHNLAISPIVSFSASGVGWGPVSKLFLTTSADNTGYLLGTATLPSAITLSADEFVTMRMAMSLMDNS